MSSDYSHKNANLILKSKYDEFVEYGKQYWEKHLRQFFWLAPKSVHFYQHKRQSIFPGLISYMVIGLGTETFPG